jgi:phage baseplate assembly protein gpV
MQEGTVTFEYSTFDEAVRSERPVVLPETPDLNRTDGAVIWLSGVHVYSFGVILLVAAMTEQSNYGLALSDYDTADGWPDEIAPIRFGIEFSDGTAISLDRAAPAGTVLEVRHSSGNAGSLQATVFLRPIPPPGPVRIITAIPKLGVSEAEASIDGRQIISASESVERLWTATPRTSRGLGGAGLRGGSWFSRWD